MIPENNMFKKPNPCAALRRRLQELQFLGVEWNLYLDTHPNDTRALQEFNRIHQEIMNVHMQIDQQCGPLCGFGHSGNKGNTWLWAEQPWPWDV